MTDHELLEVIAEIARLGLEAKGTGWATKRNNALSLIETMARDALNAAPVGDQEGHNSDDDPR